MKLSPYFTSIRKQILIALERAEHKISIAVCWFTNEELFEKVCNKLDEGLIVELLILDDYINSNPFGCNFQNFVSKNGHLYVSSVENPMHNKYCIIDSRILINGSYNWTYYAETKNEENIVIFEECIELIGCFEQDFERLKSMMQKVEVYKPKPLLDFDRLQNENRSRNTFGTFNVLSNDLFLKALATQDKKYYEAAKRVVPENIQFQKKAVELNWEKPIKLKSTLSEAIKDDKTSLIFPLGTIIPAETSLGFTTVFDYQKSMSVTLIRGESEQASRNTKIKSYSLDKIPPMKAGEVSIKSDYQITVDGKLHITKHIHDTGLVDKKTFDLNTLNILANE